MAPVILVLALLMPVALATNTNPPQCLNATLPNILNLETCLGTSLELCTNTVEDIVAALCKIVQCLISALLELNAVGAVSALLDIIELVLTLLGLDAVKLTAVIKPLCCVSNESGCYTIFKGTETCKKPITITLPGNLNLEQCFADPLLLCNEGGACTDNVLVSLVNALLCLLKILLGSNPGSLLYGLACACAGLLQSAAVTATLLIKAACLAVAAAIKLSVTCV
ncbi:uncharacterized protein LOC144100348 [Amblyomma americanum]